jgi:hypothetical protein
MVTVLRARIRKKRGSNPGMGREILISSEASRPALGPTQPTIQGVPRTLSQEAKRPKHEADQLLHLMPMLRISANKLPFAASSGAFLHLLRSSGATPPQTKPYDAHNYTQNNYWKDLIRTLSTSVSQTQFRGREILVLREM